MPLWTVFALVAASGVMVALASALALQASGGDLSTGRRLAGPREVRVGALAEEGETGRTVRVAGRIRCRDPLHVAGGERLVAYHRDVEVRLPHRGWRSLERLREARSFELWDHDGSVTLDPSLAADPLITIPSVWRGAVAELKEPHASAARVLSERQGEEAVEARATTRTINVTDRLLVLARVAVRSGGVALEPPNGGYLITNLALDDAMRLLGGHHRRVTALAVAGLGAGSVLAVAGLVGAVIAAGVRAA